MSNTILRSCLFFSYVSSTKEIAPAFQELHWFASSATTNGRLPSRDLASIDGIGPCFVKGVEVERTWRFFISCTNICLNSFFQFLRRDVFCFCWKFEFFEKVLW